MNPVVIQDDLLRSMAISSLSDLFGTYVAVTALYTIFYAIARTVAETDDVSARFAQSA